MLDGLVSNKDGISLIAHSKSVQKISLIMTSRLGLTDKGIIDAISKSSLLHDIGKAYSVFQDYIKKNVISEEYTVNKILHNEISWSVLRYLLNPDDRYDSAILYSIYWHHSREMSGEDKEYGSSILSKINEDDITLILELYNYLTGENKTKTDLDKDISTDKIPDYYQNNKKDFLPINTIVLSCVVSADRCVSSHNQERILVDDEYANKIVDLIDYSPTKEYKIPDGYDLNRFNYQLDCVNSINNANTYEIKAPAGFGKTMTGILAWIKSGNKKLVWVCPRNIIADSLYYSILKELSVLGLGDTVRVELFLTGKKQKCNIENGSEFSSDIIITNIDNFLTPTINNAVRNRLYLMMSTFVIFDEFHELISSDPYFACFVNIMKSRHRYTNSTTLLMSATPSLVTNLWDTVNNKTKILPDDRTHYNAAHDKKYKINLLKDVSGIKPINNHLFITNAISTAQKFTIDKKYSLISHSKYVESDRKAIIDNIFELFGKNKPIENKVDAVSAPIIQAAMDISFCGISEIAKSPEDTFQRIGRNGRWGEYEVVDFNIVVDINNKDIEMKESAAIRTTYDSNLNKLWIDFLKSNIKDYEYTLNELYILYNDFNIKNKKVIEKYIETQYTISVNKLSNLFPKKYNTKTKKSGKTNVVGTINGLRDNGFEKIYCIYPLYEDETKFCDAFQIEDNDDISNNEDNNTQNNQLKVVKSLLNDERFKYNSHALFKNSKFTSQKLKQKAKSKDTPYICFHKVYHKKLGLIDKKFLK